MKEPQTAPTATVPPPVGGRLQFVPVTHLKSHPLNPRMNWTPEDGGLTDSIREKGILTPLIARPIPDKQDYEVLCGSRRLAAARALKLEVVPVLVRSFDDDEAMEVMIVDNLQREGVHSLDEAQAYQTLLGRPGATLQGIAARVGKSERYVHDRLQLLRLTKDAQRLFKAGKFLPGHAVLLARLSPKDQARALDPDHGGVFRTALLPWDERKSEDTTVPVSLSELRAWIDKNVRFAPAEAHPLVFPEASEAFNRAKVEEERIVPITRDHFVAPGARDADQRTFGPASWKRAEKPCDYAVTGVVVAGPGRGEAFPVCVEKKKCAVHWGKELRDAKKRAKAALKEGKDGEDVARRQEEAAAQARSREEASRALWNAALPAVLEALAERVRKVKATVSGPLGRVLVDDGHFYRGTPAQAKMVLPGRTAEDLVRHLAWRSLLARSGDWDAHQKFPRLARSLGLDVRPILEAQAKADQK